MPFQYESVRLYPDQRPLGFQFSPFIVNIEAHLSNSHILACGEADTQELATAKAVSELIERSMLLSWSKIDSTIKTSNGWAAHPDQASSQDNAIFELVERDVVLIHRYATTSLYEVSSEVLPDKFKKWLENDLSQSEFPRLRVLISRLGLGPSVTCLLMNDQGYGVSGHSAGNSLEAALESALAEACRSAHHSIVRSFFHDTTILRDGLSSSRVAPGAHGVYYSYHEPFPEWLFGKSLTWDQGLRFWRDHNAQLRSRFPEFRLVETLKTPVFVTFAEHSDCLPLLWGPTTAVTSKTILNAMMSLGKLSRDGRLNMKPHIVA